MARLTVNIPHQLTEEEALQRIQGLLTNLKETQKDKIGQVTEQWNGKSGDFSFTAQGFDVAGTIQVKSDSVEIESSLPFALSFFKGKIKSMIEEKGKELLAK